MKRRETGVGDAIVVPITLDEGGKAPTRVHLLGPGENKTRKGIVMVDTTVMLAEHAEGGVRLAIDFDHAMARADVRPEDKRCGGSFVPFVDDAGHTYADDIQWNDLGREAVESKQWMYFSPWGDAVKDAKGRMVLRRLRNVALTNTPATHNAQPLVMSEGDKEENMPDPNMVALALGCSLDTTDTEAIALAETHKLLLSETQAMTGKTRIDEVRGALQAMKAKAERCDAMSLELSEMKTRALNDKRDALIVTLSEGGKLPPALHGWAKAQSYECLLSFGEAATPVVSAAKPTEPAPGSNIDPELERELKRSGITIEEFNAARAAGIV